MSGRDDLHRELEQWEREGRTATFWWRDDDAAGVTPALEELLRLTASLHVPLALAVIPARASDKLLARLRGETRVSLVQHGFAHVNHAPAGEKKAEYGPHRRRAAMGKELFDGAKILRGEPGWQPVLVPPWNRIDAKLPALLPGFGFRGLSTFTPRKDPHAAPGLRQVNTHLDIVNWRRGGGLVGEDVILAQAARLLAARRLGENDGKEATGLLTHHLVHDRDCWDFIKHFITLTSQYRTVKWLCVGDAFEL